MFLYIAWEIFCWGTVLLLKSFHTGRSFFLLTGRHYSLRELTHYFSMFKEFPIKIFLLKSKKLRQLRQSNLPPLFARRRSASYWAKSEMQLGYRKKYETSFERNPSVSSDLHKSDCYSLKSERKKFWQLLQKLICTEVVRIFYVHFSGCSNHFCAGHCSDLCKIEKITLGFLSKLVSYFFLYPGCISDFAQ